jgi:hypothetical protein
MAISSITTPRHKNKTLCLLLILLCGCSIKADYEPLKLYPYNLTIALSAPENYWGDTGRIKVLNVHNNETIPFSVVNTQNGCQIEFKPPLPDYREMNWSDNGNLRIGNGTAKARIKSTGHSINAIFYFECSTLKGYIADANLKLLRVEINGQPIETEELSTGIILIELSNN